MALSRVEKSIPSGLPPARLYIDDIEEIIQILKASLPPNQDGEEAKIQIQIDDRISSVPQDFINFRKRTHNISVRVSNGYPNATFEMTKNRTFWWSYGMTKTVRWDAYLKLETLFEEKKLWWRALCHALPGWVVLTFSVLITVFGTVLNQSDKINPRAQWWVATVGSVLVSLFILAFIGQVYHSTLILPYASDKRAKREELRSKLGYVLLGAAMSGISAYIIKRFVH